MAFLNEFILEPWRHRHLPLALFRFSQLLGTRTNGLFDIAYQKIMALLKPAKDLSAPTRLTTDQAATAAKQVAREGFSLFPTQLTDEELNEIRHFAFSTPARAWDGREIQLSEDNIPSNTGRYSWRARDLIQLKTIQSLICDSTMARIAQGYLGAQPKLTSVTLWLDPAFDGDFDPHVYHIDNDGPAYLKFFYYITDVTEETGAHRFIRGTHHDRKPKQFRNSIRYSDKELLDYYGADKEVVFEAPAGTILAEDTDGFHRGSQVCKDYRLLLQFEFSLIDIPMPEELEFNFTPVLISDLDPSLEDVVSKLARRGKK